MRFLHLNLWHNFFIVNQFKISFIFHTLQKNCCNRVCFLFKKTTNYSAMMIIDLPPATSVCVLLVSKHNRLIRVVNDYVEKFTYIQFVNK